ncbi:MAG: hypothetical protein HUJ94_03385, partial [Bacteroidales bacterium]|nr:hypothetical protein [Bacteroidales bacterium]
YAKVLKKSPEDYAAIKNCCVIATKQNDAKLLKKYLPLLEKYGSESDKATASARLAALAAKK